MKLKAMKSFRHGTQTFGRGAEVDLPESVAKELIERGLVAEEGSESVKRADPKQQAAKAGAHRRDKEQSARD